jgi:hypothetical protein
LPQTPHQATHAHHRGFQIMGEHMHQVAPLIFQPLHSAQIPEDDHLAQKVRFSLIARLIKSRPTKEN